MKKHAKKEKAAPISKTDNKKNIDKKLDEALKGSFPASDATAKY